MIEKRQFKKTKFFNGRAQAIVEFAIALPILLALIIGILEVSRLVFIYASVTNASRNASRYASAVGFEETGTYLKYVYCDGIKDVAIQSAYLMNLNSSNITISYDTGPSTTSLGNCTTTGGNDMTIEGLVDSGDRVTVTVTAQYKPMLKLIPIGNRTITSTSSRTILGIIDLDN